MPLLNGKIIAAQIRSSLKDYIEHLPKKPGLAVILVGNDPASHLYVSLKEKACLSVGIHFEKYLFPTSATAEEILNKINELNHRQNVDGILVQLPLPNQDTDKIIAAIEPKKDVDGFHPENLQNLENNKPGIISPVVLGVMNLLETTNEPLAGKKAALVMSKIFAQPFEAILSHKKITTEIISAEIPNLKDKIKNSDIIITAVGKPNLITGEMIKNGAIIIDVGTTRVGSKVVGDVDQSSVEPVAGWLTPVPGGVGPMTVAMLLRNVVEMSSKN
ncbi:MAG: bifunctional 5,10-methylenetetrahydrofolate dehydrogenase/5,10-methenyltetrahydrofolate cyclohydrolase [Candidatus Uhrbacteria bacterium]